MIRRNASAFPVAGGWQDQFEREGVSLSATIAASSSDRALRAGQKADHMLG
jgi:hypothetical protein